MTSRSGCAPPRWDAGRSDQNAGPAPPTRSGCAPPRWDAVGVTRTNGGRGESAAGGRGPVPGAPRTGCGPRWGSSRRNDRLAAASGRARPSGSRRWARDPAAVARSTGSTTRRRAGPRSCARLERLPLRAGLDRPGCGLSDPIDTVFTGPASPGRVRRSTSVLDVLDGLGLALGAPRRHVLRRLLRPADRRRPSGPGAAGWSSTAGRSGARWRSCRRSCGSPPLPGPAPGAERRAPDPGRRAGPPRPDRPDARRSPPAGSATRWSTGTTPSCGTPPPSAGELAATGRSCCRRPAGLDPGLTLPTGAARAASRRPPSFLWGDGDPFWRRGRRPGPGSPMIPGAQLELLPGAGHAVWMDDAGHVANATRRFLDPHG